MKDIEDEFQKLVEKIISKSVTQIDEIDKMKVDRFFALWKSRALFRNEKKC